MRSNLMKTFLVNDKNLQLDKIFIISIIGGLK